jgi:hypothetical protein
MVREVLKSALMGVLLGVMAVASLVGIAAAVWSAIGAGLGSASAGTTVAVTLSPGTPTATLLPGGRTDVTLTIINSNVTPVRVGSLAIDASRGTNGFAVDAGHSGCVLSALTYTVQTNGSAGWTTPAKVGSVNGTLPVTLTSALEMSLSAVNACQGATFTIFLVGQP